MNKKRALSILMAAAMAAGTLVTSVPVYADDVEEITWMFWDDLEATEDLISKGYKDVIDRFNEEYDGKYHVTPITTNLEEYDGKLNALIAAGQTPDVYICNPGPNMDVYVNAGAAADLTDILENQEADWYASFTDGIFERMTYDGKIMAVPTNFAAACVYYNTEMFADAGVEVPTTYDELIAACQKLQDAGYTPISCSAGTAWCLSMIAGYLCDRQGVDLAAIADHTANWTDENCIEAGTKLKDLSSISRLQQPEIPTTRLQQLSITAKQLCWFRVPGQSHRSMVTTQTLSPNVVYSSSLELTVQMTRTV